MSTSLLLCAANVLSTFFLLGLIWTVQMVHYPSFAYISHSNFVDFERFHQRRISYVVLPTMLTEMVTSISLLWLRPTFFPLWAAVAGLVLIGVVWLSTFLRQVPLHARLMEGACDETINKLVQTNWIRTWSWTARGALLAWVVVLGWQSPGGGP